MNFNVSFSTPVLVLTKSLYLCTKLSCGQWRTQKVFEGVPKFRHNRATSQINLGSAEGTTIIGWSGGMPRENVVKLHLKISIFVPVKSEVSRKPKKRSHMLRNPGRTPNTREKPAMLLLNLLNFAL